MRPLIGAIPWLAAVLGAMFVLLGLGMLIGLRLPPGLTALNRVGRNRKPGEMFAFGVGYALASASCSLALLLAVVTQALAGTGWGTVLLVFAAYAAGASVLLITLSVVTAFANTMITRYLRRLMPHINRITGTVLALSGGYLLVYWLPQLFGGTPGTTVLSGIAGPLSSWLSSNQLSVLVGVGALVVAILIGALLRRSSSRRSAAEEESHRLAVVDDCCTPTLDPVNGNPDV